MSSVILSCLNLTSGSSGFFVFFVGFFKFFWPKCLDNSQAQICRIESLIGCLLCAKKEVRLLKKIRCIKEEFSDGERCQTDHLGE